MTEPARRILVADIQRGVAAYYGLGPLDLRGA